MLTDSQKTTIRTLVTIGRELRRTIIPNADLVDAAGAAYDRDHTFRAPWERGDGNHVCLVALRAFARGMLTVAPAAQAIGPREGLCPICRTPDLDHNDAACRAEYEDCNHERTRMDDGISSCLDCGDRLDTDALDDDDVVRIDNPCRWPNEEVCNHGTYAAADATLDDPPRLALCGHRIGSPCLCEDLDTFA